MATYEPKVPKVPTYQLEIRKIQGRGTDLVAIRRNWYYALLLVLTLNCLAAVFQLVTWVVSA